MNPLDTARSRRRLLIAMAFLGLSIVLAQVFKDQLFNLMRGQTEVTRITPPPCDINRQPCPLPVVRPNAPDAPWHFSITPRPVPVSRPLTLTLAPLDQLPETHRPSAVWVDLTGESMDMGLIRIALTPTPDGRWEGTGSIPVCITGQMRWRAGLHMQLEQTLIQADWVFVAPTTESTQPSHQS
jgi:hypothetical protein